MMKYRLRLLMLLLLLSLNVMIQCRPSALEEDHSRSKRQAVVADRQFVGGLSTLGALVQPILFMIGVANFMGRLPTFFTRVRDRLSNSLAASGAPAGAGRKRRSLHDSAGLTEKMDHVFNSLKEAKQKYQTKS